MAPSPDDGNGPSRHFIIAKTGTISVATVTLFGATASAQRAPLRRPQAAVAGAGLADLEARALAEPLADGRLVTVLDDWTASYDGLSLYFPGHHQPARLRALIDLIRERAARET